MRTIVLVIAMLLAGCSPTEQGGAIAAAREPDAAGQTATHPASGLQIIDVAIVRGDKRIVFKSELAATQEEQARGLMFRNELADDEGMLFPSDTPAVRSFWMKNTPLSLDIIFIGIDGRISNIEAGVPYELQSVQSIGQTSAVFEIRGGLSEELGIAPGDRVEYTLPE